MPFSSVANQNAYPFVLPELPYGKDDFKDTMSARTFDFHHGKHHNAYVTNLNKLLENHALKGKNLEDIVLETAGKTEYAGIFNNAAQVWNHTFFWHSISPNGGGKPKGKLLEKIEQDFGSFEKFCEDFKANGAGQFGSGWVWLVADKDGKLHIVKTPNAETPITRNLQPLITCDVWEHAYYLDYQNRRPDFLTVFLEKLVNWSFAELNLKS